MHTCVSTHPTSSAFIFYFFPLILQTSFYDSISLCPSPIPALFYSLHRYPPSTHPLPLFLSITSLVCYHCPAGRVKSTIAEESDLVTPKQRGGRRAQKVIVFSSDEEEEGKAPPLHVTCTLHEIVLFPFFGPNLTYNCHELSSCANSKGN